MLYYLYFFWGSCLTGLHCFVLHMNHTNEPEALLCVLTTMWIFHYHEKRHIFQFHRGFSKQPKTVPIIG